MVRIPSCLQAKIEQASGFVTTSGTNFVLNGQIQKLAGSNGYFLPFRLASQMLAYCEGILS
jgi:hypothetical protein